tara:strand:+ start:743 stop:1003 length:261 start_codon:yes stop_codon:yes gene_type:complete
MNMRDCKKMKPGAIVTDAYVKDSEVRGMVLHKEYILEEHYAKVLGGKKQARYDLYVHWLKRPRYREMQDSPDKIQCWEVKLLKNGE